MYQDRYIHTRGLALLGAVIGFAFFLLIAGYRILDPFYYEWILNENDTSLSLFGWMYYCKTSYADSLFGSFDATYPHELSIVFTDCIVPFAVIAKILFGHFLQDGQITQYIGIWGAVCYILHGLFAGLIVNKIITGKVMQIGGIILYVSSPILMFRFLGHNTLIAQWLLLASICLFLYRDEVGKRRWVISIFLVIFGAAIHLYFMPMLLIMMGGQIVLTYIEEKEWIFPTFCMLVSIAGCFLEMYLLGAFSSDLSQAEVQGSMYVYTSNLLTFFNPLDFSLFLPGLPQGWGQYEGYGYLGLGGGILFFIMVICGLVAVMGKGRITQIRKKMYLVVIGEILFCFLLSVGPVVTLGSNVLFEIPMPEFTDFFFATFRSIGRFVWIADYLILSLSLSVMEKLKRNAAKKNVFIVLFTFIVVLQFIDLSSAIGIKRENYAGTRTWTSQLQDEKWALLAKTHKYVYPIFEGAYPFPNDISKSVILYAYQNDLILTAMYIAHTSDTMQKEAEQYYEDIFLGKANREAIYWFESEEKMKAAGEHIHCESIDGIFVGWVQEEIVTQKDRVENMQNDKTI